ncbi:MAG: hypothetical protein PHS92_02025 [Candidatus Gracilibacteria bacterium]|nr:hypothetical protein [Candidatus Gracilibacteria bacterium]
MLINNKRLEDIIEISLYGFMKGEIPEDILHKYGFKNGANNDIVFNSVKDLMEDFKQKVSECLDTKEISELLEKSISIIEKIALKYSFFISMSFCEIGSILSQYINPKIHDNQDIKKILEIYLNLSNEYLEDMHDNKKIKETIDCLLNGICR